MSLALSKGEQSPVLLSFPTHGSFSHVPWPKHLVCPIFMGLSRPVGGWVHLSIQRDEDNPWPKVKSKLRSEQEQLQLWSSTTQPRKPKGSSAQLNKMELKPGS